MDTTERMLDRAESVYDALYPENKKFTQMQAGTDIIALAVVISSITLAYGLDYDDMMEQVQKLLLLNRPDTHLPDQIVRH